MSIMAKILPYAQGEPVGVYDFGQMFPAIQKIKDKFISIADDSDIANDLKYRVYRGKQAIQDVVDNETDFFPMSGAKAKIKDLPRLRIGEYYPHEISAPAIHQSMMADTQPHKLPTALQYFDNLYNDVGGLKGLRGLREASARTDSPGDRFDEASAKTAWGNMVKNYTNQLKPLLQESIKEDYPILSKERKNRLNTLDRYINEYNKIHEYPTGNNLDLLQQVGLKGLRTFTNNEDEYAHYDPSVKQIVWHPNKATNNTNAFVTHHEFTHALQDSQMPNNNSQLSNLRSAGQLDRYMGETPTTYRINKPIELEANLSGIRAMYGKPIINAADSRKFMNWVDSNADTIWNTSNEDTAGNPILKYIQDKRDKDPKINKSAQQQRKQLIDVMQLIVDNQQQDKERFIA